MEKELVTKSKKSVSIFENIKEDRIDYDENCLNYHIAYDVFLHINADTLHDIYKELAIKKINWDINKSENVIFEKKIRISGHKGYNFLTVSCSPRIDTSGVYSKMYFILHFNIQYNDTGEGVYFFMPAETFHVLFLIRKSYLPINGYPISYYMIHYFYNIMINSLCNDDSVSLARLKKDIDHISKDQPDKKVIVLGKLFKLCMKYNDKKDLYEIEVMLKNAPMNIPIMYLELSLNEICLVYYKLLPEFVSFS